MNSLSYVEIAILLLTLTGGFLLGWTLTCSHGTQFWHNGPQCIQNVKELPYCILPNTSTIYYAENPKLIVRFNVTFNNTNTSSSS